MIRRQFTISGKVQGVWFRAGTREQALLLGLSGYAANLADGRVEVQAQGAAEAVARLEQWLWQGPVLATVDSMDVMDMASMPQETGFRIL